ncbi:hypothetical protein HHO41_21040 [Bacillus sp. DNRA2]|uniref:hypothetical protein n=1 Tax=Bacillus sp. DNRA2 TaxID=2723053 RepID=UPI00145E4531|nr:hypothetical protein [Bacillus sp. DNRA2]NMD72716.1 hypothetical protein [Bacillus sp. DNRA2]
MLEEIISFFIELGESSGDFDHQLEYIFPSFMVRNEIDKCKKTVFELQEYATDSFQHILTPLQEYALHLLIEWYITGIDEEYNTITDVSNFTPKSENDEYIIEHIDNLESFQSFLFDDWDFLNVDSYVNMFFKSPQLLEMFNINLDEYIELMPYDIRDRYLQKRRNNQLPNEVSENIEELIIRLIYSAIKQKELDPRRLLETKEMQLSDDIAHILQTSLADKGVIVARARKRWDGSGVFLINSILSNTTSIV